ncbi:MAG: peptide deformylase [Frankia sp.]
MAVLPIRTVGDPVLRTPADPVVSFDARLERLVNDMIDTMYAAPGVGLAAPQIGVGLRVFVFDTEYDSDEPASERRPFVVVNPVLTPGAGVQDRPEGCLSVPGLYFPTPRALTASVSGVDASGAPVEYSGEGLLARCFQHEVDHLDGTLYLAHLTGEDRKAAQAALREGPVDPAEAERAGRELRFLRRSG